MDKSSVPCQSRASFEVVERVQEDHPILDWNGNVPVARTFDDPYFSLHDGLAETSHVFLAGNDLPNRFADGFHIAELGFGTGLNAFASLASWRQSNVEGVLRYTSFERFPMPAEDMRRALAAFPDILAIAEPIVATRQDANYVTYKAADLQLKVIIGDARTTLADWEDQADAWFLDGFAPAKNPELWEPSLIKEVSKHTAPGGTVATYSAAGAIRRALSEAGFDVERVPGFGRKRHMTKARLP